MPAHARLTDPHTVAMATRTERAGEFALDLLGRHRVYVPQQCVGTRRCPLIVVLATTGIMAELRPGMDREGIVVLETNFTADPEDLLASFAQARRHPALELLDGALKQVFRQFAIDPDKIALMGRCGTTGAAGIWGRHNPNVFKRVILNSGSAQWLDFADPRDTTVEVLLISGMGEGGGINNAARAQELRRQGRPTIHALGFRGHEHQWEDYYFIARWLRESWAPAPAGRPAPRTVADPLPVLTTEALARMTAFWTRFQQEPDSIRTTARRAHLHNVTLPLSEAPPWIGMVDMPALAAKYPSVAAALKRAGLTAQQHDAYRIALASARLVMETLGRLASNPNEIAPLGAELLTRSMAVPVLRQNVEFLRAHPDELKPLDATGMWRTP